MIGEFSPSLFFASARPPVVDLPHLITSMDAELMAQVVHLTGSAPGLWHLPAPYDENDVYNPWRDDTTPFSLWELPANQAELLAPGRYAGEALFGTKAVLFDSSIDEAAVIALAETRGRRRDNGGFYVDALHDLPALPKIIEVTRWALMPVAPDRSYGLFVTTSANAAWIEKLAAWCDRNGRSRCRVTMNGDQPALIDTNASDEARERAAASEIERFLGRMESYFRLGNEGLIPRVQQRIDADRRLQEKIAEARKVSTGPA